MEPAFRALSTNERELLEKLLEPRFPGCDELRAQLDGLAVKELDDEGCLAFECRSGPAAEVKWPIPAEGEGPGPDGAVHHVALHVVDGFINKLVVWSEASEKASGLPSARGISVFAPYSEDAGVWNTAEKFR
jgi:hypothetical protein